METMGCETTPLNELHPLVYNMVPLYEMPGYNAARSSIGKYRAMIKENPNNFKASNHLAKWQSRMETLKKMCRERNKTCEVGVQTGSDDITIGVVEPKLISPTKEVVKEVVTSIWIPSQLSWD